MVEKTDGCTGLIVMPERSASGRLLHAHNWDWREECVDTGIVLKIRAEDGNDVLTFCEAGALARHGFNLAVAGRLAFGESESQTRAGYARLFAALGVGIDHADPERLTLFPDMEPDRDVAEITESCWGEIWTRPGLERKTRRCMVIASMIALGRSVRLTNPHHVPPRKLRMIAA